MMPKAKEMALVCPKCKKPMTLKKHFIYFNCQCFTYTLPIRADGTYIKNGKVCVVCE